MDELTRSRYLQALGTDVYISREQLPGAAATRRLMILRQPSRPQVARAPARNAIPAQSMPTLEAVPTSTVADAAPVRPVSRNHCPEFSLVAINCGGWLWLEEQESGDRLHEQLILVQSIAQALGVFAGDKGAQASSTQFDWPIHNNRQLDQGEEAARSSVAGFIQRKLEQLRCRGLVLLGAECERRLALDQLDSARVMRTVSTAQMLRNPLLKRQAWQDLYPFIQPE